MPTISRVPDISLVQRAQDEHDRRVQEAQQYRQVRLYAQSVGREQRLGWARTQSNRRTALAQQQAEATKSSANLRMQQAQETQRTLGQKVAAYEQQMQKHLTTALGHLLNIKTNAGKSVRSYYHSITSIPEAGYQGVFDAAVAAGKRLVWFQGYTSRGRTYFNTVWVYRGKDKTAWEARHGLDSAGFDQLFAEWRRKGYLLQQVATYLSGGSIRYAAIGVLAPTVVRTITRSTVTHGLTAAQHKAELEAHIQAGYRITCQCATEVAGTVSYAAIYDKLKVADLKVFSDMDSDTYQSKIIEYQNANPPLAVAYLHAFNVGADVRYSAIWHPTTSNKSWAAYHNMRIETYYAREAELLAKGLTPRLVVAYDYQGDVAYAAVWSA